MKVCLACSVSHPPCDIYIYICWISGFRNSAAETVEQELLFVGSETGKLTAMRELVKKVFWSD